MQPGVVVLGAEADVELHPVETRLQRASFKVHVVQVELLKVRALPHPVRCEFLQPPPEAGARAVDDGAGDESEVHGVQNHHGVVDAVLPVEDRVVRDAGMVGEHEEGERVGGVVVVAVDVDDVRAQRHVRELDVKRTLRSQSAGPVPEFGVLLLLEVERAMQGVDIVDSSVEQNGGRDFTRRRQHRCRTHRQGQT